MHLLTKEEEAKAFSLNIFLYSFILSDEHIHKITYQLHLHKG